MVTRITRNFSLSKRWWFQPGLLSIYHTGTDRYINEAGQKEAINGSQGLTLNSIFHLQYETGNKSHINLSAGLPLVVRDVRPDGLTRKFVVSLEYTFRF